jgi:hypothetical protein
MPELSDWPNKVWLLTKVTVEVESVELDTKTVTEAQEELVYVVTREACVFAQARGERDPFERLSSQLSNKTPNLLNQRVFRHELVRLRAEAAQHRTGRQRLLVGLLASDPILRIPEAPPPVPSALQHTRARRANQTIRRSC